MTKKAPVDHTFAALVRRDAFGETTPAEARKLRSPKYVERFQVELMRVAASTQQMIENHRGGTRVQSSGWEHRARVVFKVYSERLGEIRPLVKELAHKRIEGDAGALLAEVSRLRGAIRAHAASAASAEVEPEDHDLALWAQVTRASA